MKPTTYIIIGLAAIAVVSTGFCIYFLGKSGEYRAEVKMKEDKVKLLTEHMSKLQASADTINKKLIEETAQRAKLAAREKIYQEKIQVDSLLLEEIKESNERIDSLSANWSLDDWIRYIATDQIPEDRSN